MHRLAANPRNADRIVALEDETVPVSLRSKFARDRDRILFTKSFRRLAKKTQVYFAGPESEHHRTRLTHTLEVAQISKTISVALDLSVELTEAIAFGHDVGHAPFGHAGERQLNRILSGEEPLPSRVARWMGAWQSGRRRGNFKHNFQSVRLLTFLEEYHPAYDGLDLTVPTLEGILKHTMLKWKADRLPRCEYPDTEPSLWDRLIGDGEWCRTLEGQVVAVADEIAQVAHDLSDAISLSILPLPEILSRVEIQKALEAAKAVEKSFDLATMTGTLEHRANVTNALVLSACIDYFVRATIDKFRSRISTLDKEGAFVGSTLLPNGPEPVSDFQALLEFKDNLVVNNFQVNRMDNKGCFAIRQLFEAYVSDPRQLPDSALKAYLIVKNRELNRKGALGCEEWIEDVTSRFAINPEKALTPSEKTAVMNFLQSADADGPRFRRLPSGLLEKMTVYMALDGDFVRTLVDFISGMTDEFALEEVGRLYR